MIEDDQRLRMEYFCLGIRKLPLKIASVFEVRLQHGHGIVAHYAEHTASMETCGICRALLNPAHELREGFEKGNS